jgi:hypothetical protein
MSCDDQPAYRPAYPGFTQLGTRPPLAYARLSGAAARPGRLDRACVSVAAGRSGCAGCRGGGFREQSPTGVCSDENKLATAASQKCEVRSDDLFPCALTSVRPALRSRREHFLPSFSPLPVLILYGLFF